MNGRRDDRTSSRIRAGERVRAAALVVAVALLLAGCVTGLSPGSTATVDGSGAGTPTVDRTATVTRVVDGDTVEVAYPDGTADTIRLIGVDTPEVHVENEPDEFESVPATTPGRDCLRRYGERAGEFAADRLSDATVGLAFDPNLDRRGNYGRLLAYVIVDGESGTFNRRLVERGLARVYESDFTRRGTYRTLEATARQEQRGLWACATGA